MITDQYGRAFEILDAIATRENAGDFFSFLGVLPDPDPVLRKLGDEARVLADLEADDQVTALTLARKNRALARRDYWFKPGALRDQSPSPAAAVLCDRLVKDFENLSFREIISGILTAPFYGLAVLEISWEIRDGWWHIKNLELKPAGWFAFDRENRLVFKGESQNRVRAVPEGKFILARHCPTYENPYGLRLLSRCLWPVAFKKGGLSFYTRYLEKYGTPWAVGYAPSQASEAEMDKMAANLSRMVRDATAVLPYGAKLELAAGAAAGTGEQHEAYLRRMDAAIAKVLTGNTLTSEVADKGSYAAAAVHQEGAEDFAQADMDLVISALNDLAWHYARLNAGPDELAPVFEYEEAADLEKLAALDQKLHGLGVRFRAEYFEKRYSLAPDEFFVAPEETLEETPKNIWGAAGPPNPRGFNFAGGAAAPPADKYWGAIEVAVRSYAPRAAAENGKIFSQVWKIVDEARDFEELERSLGALLGAETGPGDFEDLLAELMLQAGLMGRFEEAGKRDSRLRGNDGEERGRG